MVHDGPNRHPCAPALGRPELEYLTTLTDHAALLLEHARHVADARRTEQARQDQAAQLRDLDRLAAVGAMAVRVARESRNPIASITAFARSAHRELAEDDPHREYSEIVLRESERLDAMLGEQMEYSPLHLQRPRPELQSLNTVVQEALQRCSEALGRRRVQLLKRLSPDLPPLLLDAHRIKRLAENIVAYALESLPMAGRIKVASRRANGYVVVNVAHDGVRQADDLLDRLLVPFTSGGSGGAEHKNSHARVPQGSPARTPFAITSPPARGPNRPPRRGRARPRATRGPVSRLSPARVRRRSAPGALEMREEAPHHRKLGDERDDPHGTAAPAATAAAPTSTMPRRCHQTLRRVA